MKVNEKDNHVLNWERLAVLFNATSVREMSVEEYEAEFDTKFPAPVPTPKPARPKIVDPWIRIAEEILERDFNEDPVDRSTRKSLMIGLRAETDLLIKGGIGPTQADQTGRLVEGGSGRRQAVAEA